jgi:GT2 family glycosyltransferase
MRRIDASAERGKVPALNIGLAAAQGRAFLFCDSDDTVPAGWLAAMATALARHDFVATFSDPAPLNDGWVLAYRARKKGLVLRRLTHPPHCSIAGGAEIGFTRRVLDAVGGFDPAFKVQEDHDFCIRAHLAGFELHPVPETCYNYRFREDFPSIYRQAFSYARYRALLRKRYAPEPFLSPVPWLQLGQRLLRLGGTRAAAALRQLRRGGPLPPLERARFNAKLGQALGDAAGAIAFRVAPPRRRAGPQGGFATAGVAAWLSLLG